MSKGSTITMRRAKFKLLLSKASSTSSNIVHAFSEASGSSHGSGPSFATNARTRHRAVSLAGVAASQETCSVVAVAAAVPVEVQTPSLALRSIRPELQAII